MLEEAGSVLGNAGQEESIVRVGRQLGALQEMHLLIQDRAVGGGLQIVYRGMGQPDSIVGDVRAHALSERRQPPVLYVTFGKLAASGTQQMFTSQSG